MIVRIQYWYNDEMVVFFQVNGRKNRNQAYQKKKEQKPKPEIWSSPHMGNMLLHSAPPLMHEKMHFLGETSGGN